MTKIETFLTENKKMVEALLAEVNKQNSAPQTLTKSIDYSLLAGGKRLRPILLFASYDAYANRNREKTYRTATALEMIHSYSLIHDDLPAMDDDDYRRGKLTNHKKFDEATAILAGDGLLTDSFYLISTDEMLTAEEKVYMIKELAKASGTRGMVGGQILDMAGEDKQLTVEELEQIHALKTGKLIEFAVVAGAYLAIGKEINETALRQFSYYLGLIFQVQDDILDIVGDPNKLGKPVGSDEESNKSTYPNLLGLEGAKEKKAQYISLAEKALAEANATDSFLMDLLHHFGNRDH